MLKALFTPAIRGMNRMSFVVKFLFIGILLFIPFAFVTHLMRSESEQQIRFHQKEHDGVVYISPAFRLLGHIQNCRTYSAALLCGEGSFQKSLEREWQVIGVLLPTLDAMDLKYRDQFKAHSGRFVCSERWEEIRREWLALRARRFGTAQESLESHNYLCTIIIEWILNDAANYSGLTLDSELDSHWLMEAYVEKLPQITEDIAQACARSILYLKERREGTSSASAQEEERLGVHDLYSDALGVLDAFVDVNLKTAYDVSRSKGRSLQSRLDAPTERTTRVARDYLAAIKRGVITAAPASPADPLDLVDKGGQALAATRILHSTVGPELDRLIQFRLGSYRRDETMAMIAAASATLLYIYMFIGFCMAINASVARVAAFTQLMIEGTKTRFKLDCRDELGRVAESFNQINELLNLTRDYRDQVEHRGEELRASEERFRTLASRAPVGIFLADASGDCLYVNERWCTLASLSPERARGKGWLEALHPEDRDRVSREWYDAARSGASSSSEYRFGNGSAIVWLSGNAVALRDRSGTLTGILGSVTDITEQKRVERLKDEFISTVSHELRTPLTSIRGSLGLIAGGVAGAVTPKARSMIDIAKKNCERLVRLVSDILDIEKIEMGKMSLEIRATELGPLLEQAVEANRGFAQSLGVGIHLDTGAGGARVLVDPDRLTQVLTNLLSNAAKFSPKGGVVRVRVCRQAESVRISVQDQGPGIPQAFQPRLFQRFAQADGSDGRPRQGTGLGLSICKAIVERMGGKIGFSSEEGKGATFSFDIPLECKTPVVPPPHRPDRPHLLVCEDDPDIATVLGGFLDSEGYNVDVAPTAAHAKELLKRNRYVGMTLDLALPDQDGISLVRALREEAGTRHLPIVIISAYMEEGRRAINGDGFGILDWLEKPIDVEKLRRAIARTSACFQDRRPSILHVEDDPDIFRVVQAALCDRAEVVQSASLADARRRIRGEKYDLLILDIGLPDGSGLELLPVLRSSAHAATPVIIFSAQEMNSKTARHVQATLLKSAASNEDLVATIQAILGNPIYSTESAPAPVSA